MALQFKPGARNEKYCLWWLDLYGEGLRLRKLVTNRWVHVYPGLVFRGRGKR